MRVFIGVLLVFLTTLIANLMCQKYRDRQVFFLKLNSFHEKIKREVLYSQKSVKKILEEDDFFDFSKILLNYLENNKFLLNLKYLRKNDFEFIKSYCENVGVADADSQLKYLQSVDAQVVELFNQAKEEQEIYCKLYIKLGFLIGLIILVVIL